LLYLLSKEMDPTVILNKGGKLEHVGYMNPIFNTKTDACSYYDRHNKHMRSLNAHDHYKSDWDPNTHLLYSSKFF